MADEAADLITARIEPEVVDERCGADSLVAALVYDPADPFAVTLAFRTDTQQVTWTFGRDLLIEGLYEPTGDGDMHIWPYPSSVGCAVVILELC